jgi:FkbM family methyltransferase
MSNLPITLTDPTILSTWKVRNFVNCWPKLWWIIKQTDNVLPSRGSLRELFEHYVFTRSWARWHRFAYIPEYRDIFFDYILRFFYRYPIARGDVVLQIGASCGEETLRFAKSVGSQGRVIAVEPVPSNVERLQDIFTEDKFPQVSVVAKAAASRCGLLRFFLGVEKEGRLADIPAENLTYEWWGVEDHLNEQRYKGVTTVQADTPDNIIEPFALNRLDFILVETNGTELEVVQAMDKILSITKRIGARGHVQRDGVPIHIKIAELLTSRGFDVTVTDEGMVLGRNKAFS